MTTTPDVSLTELPDRLCTWCQVPMKKRLVGRKQFVHYNQAVLLLKPFRER